MILQELLEGIRKQGYSKPTPIQAQACPAGLGGRDVIGVARTLIDAIRCRQHTLGDRFSAGNRCC